MRSFLKKVLQIVGGLALMIGLSAFLPTHANAGDSEHQYTVVERGPITFSHFPDGSANPQFSKYGDHCNGQYGCELIDVYSAHTNELIGRTIVTFLEHPDPGKFDFMVRRDCFLPGGTITEVVKIHAALSNASPIAPGADQVVAVNYNSDEAGSGGSATGMGRFSQVTRSKMRGTVEGILGDSGFMPFYASDCICEFQN